MRYHIINPEDATATASGERIEMSVNAIDDVRGPVSAQIQMTFSIEAAEKIISEFHAAVLVARLHRANR
jgi:CheY-specific phosphatase CheX